MLTDIHLVARLIGSTTKHMALLKKHMMLSLMKPMGLIEQENLDDVRSDGLRNTMKNMSIGDVRPREEDEDGPSISIRVNPSTSTSNDQAQPIVQDSSNDDSQVQDQVGSSSAPSTSTQEPIAPQRIHHVLAKDHPMDQIMGDISKCVQTRSCIASFLNTTFLYLFLNLTVWMKL